MPGRSDRRRKQAGLPPPAHACELLRWDSDLFGFRVARVRTTAPGEPDIEAALSYCRRRRVRCLYLLCDAQAVEGATLACRSGFDLVDVRVTLERALPADESGQRAAAGVVLRAATVPDLPALQRLAGDAFLHSRFSVDRRFPRDRVALLYRRWAERDLRARGHHVVVAEQAGELIGFASGSVERGGGGRVGLVAVDERRRGTGLSGPLLDALLDRFRQAGASRACVVTQGRNTPALRAYERRGFQTVAVQLWLHAWFDGVQGKRP